MEPALKPPTGRTFKLNTIEDAARLLLEPDLDERRTWDTIRKTILTTAMCLRMGLTPLDHVYIDDGKDDVSITMKNVK